MEFINDLLLSKIFELNLLLDGYVKRIEIFLDDYNRVNINIKVEINNDNSFNYLDLYLSVITQYHFSYTNDILFYLIDRFKLLKVNDFYYLSLNPSNDDKTLDEKDEDVIYFGNMRGVLS